MYNVKFILFSDEQVPDKSDADIIRRLTSRGYAPFVDSQNMYRKQWFIKNCHHEHLLFLSGGTDFWVFDRSKVHKPPQLGVFFNEGQVLDQDQRAMLVMWVRAVCYNFWPSNPVDADNLESFGELLQKPVTAEPVITSKKAEVINEYGDAYMLDFKYLEKIDVMVYQVIKPHTDRPYTTYTKRYSERGHLPFFTSLFKCNSWGICGADISFLKQTWSHLNMKGEFDIAQLWKERVAACTPQPGELPEEEPEVWRNDLKYVIKLLEYRFKGRTDKRVRIQEDLIEYA